MLTGPDLGKAIAEAIRLKGVSKAAVARHFGIAQPSVYTWIAHGRIGKQHLEELVEYFSDVVGPAHWGRREQPTASHPAQLDRAILGVALTATARVIEKRGLRMEGVLGTYAPVVAFAYELARDDFPSGPPSPDTRSGKVALRTFDQKVEDWLEGGLKDESIRVSAGTATGGAKVPARRAPKGKTAAPRGR